MTMFPLCNPILMGGVGTRVVMHNATNSHQTYACHLGKLLGHCPCDGFWRNKMLVNDLIDKFIDNDKDLGVLFDEIHQANLRIIKGARWLLA